MIQAPVYPAGAREDQKGSVWLISISRKDVFAKLAPFQEGEGDESRRGSGHFVIQRRRDGRSRRLKVSTAVRVIGSIAADNSDREFRPLAAFCAPFLLFLATKPEPEDWIVRFLRFCFSSFLSFFPFLPFFQPWENISATHFPRLNRRDIKSDSFRRISLIIDIIIANNIRTTTL